MRPRPSRPKNAGNMARAMETDMLFLRASTSRLCSSLVLYGARRGVSSSRGTSA